MSTREFDPRRGVVLVTGIGLDHGVRVAVQYLDAGWNVAVTARTVTELVQIMADKPVRRFFAVVADPSDTRQAARILDRVVSRFGAINQIVDPVGAVAAVWHSGEIAEAAA